MTLTVGTTDTAPALKKKGRGWVIDKKRLDAIHDQSRRNRMMPSSAQKLLGISLEGSVG